MKLETNDLIVQTAINVSDGFSCQLCGLVCKSQFDFFAHLKEHYENNSEETGVKSVPIDFNLKDIGQEIIINTADIVNCSVIEETDESNANNNLIKDEEVEEEVGDDVEFSETEDMMEVMDGVDDEVENELNADWSERATSTTPLQLISMENNSPGEIIYETSMLEEHTFEVQHDLIDEKSPDTECENVVCGDNARKAVKCLKCGKMFNSKNSYQYHKLIHLDKRPHICDVCGKGFLTSGALKVHLRLHSGAKPYPCKFCGRYFRQWGDMNYHIESIHSDEKKFQCEFCGKNFARRYSLVVHRRIHTGERNYVCEYCNKTFRASSYLQNHRKIHTGEKNHQCEICSKKFRVRSDMKRHWKTHNREYKIKVDDVQIDPLLMDDNQLQKVEEIYYDLQTQKREKSPVKNKKSKTKSTSAKKSKCLPSNAGGGGKQSGFSSSIKQSEDVDLDHKYVVKVKQGMDADDIKPTVTETGDIIIWPINYV